jgi:hypothetical protein
MKNLIIVLMVLVALPGFGQTSEGPNSPGTISSSTPGLAAWSNIGNIASQNDTYATASGYETSTHYIKAQNFGFSIPSGATINGIIVEVDAYQADGAYDYIVSLILADGSYGFTNKNTGANFPTSDSDTYRSYGSSSYLWDETLEETDINDADFGVVVQFYLSGYWDDNLFEEIAAYIYVDHIRITIYYTETASSSIGKVAGVAYSSTAKVSGVAKANIGKIIGVE